MPRLETRKSQLARLKIGIRDALTHTSSSIANENLVSATEEIRRTLASYEYKKNDPHPTAAAERDSLNAVVAQAKSFRRTWKHLHYSIKHKLAAADPKSFAAIDQFDAKLEDVLERAHSLLDPLLTREEIHKKSQTIKRHKRTGRDFMGKPTDIAKCEAFMELCVTWLLFTDVGRESLTTGRWRRGSKERAFEFVDSLFKVVEEDCSSESNRKLLGSLYSDAIAAAKAHASSQSA